MTTRLGCRSKLLRFWLPIIIAVCTILQSMAHAWWTMYGREFIACELKVKRKFEFYLYLTYFYSNDCDNYALNEYAAFTFNSSQRFPLAHLYKHDGTMTKPLLDFCLGLDALWIVTSVSLLIGVIMRLKQCSAFVFYIPWVVVAIITLALDLFSAIFFATRMPNAEVLQSSAFWKLDAHVIMAIFSGRLGIIWLLNLFSTLYICWFARRAYLKRYAEEEGRGRKLRVTRSIENESRIKNWQVFYGASLNDSQDINYTSTFKDLEEFNKCQASEPENGLCSTFKSSSSLTEAKDNQVQKRVQIRDLVSHLPWSYIDPSHRTVIKKEKCDPNV